MNRKLRSIISVLIVLLIILNMNIYFYTLGCKVNQYETQEMSELLEKIHAHLKSLNYTDEDIEYFDTSSVEDIIKNMKFNIEENGINTFVVKEHPTWLKQGYEEESIKKILEILDLTKIQHL